MSEVDLSQSPYNDGYDESKFYSMVLYRAGRPALSQELLEQQSMNNEQLEMLGDTQFAEGAIISGMDIVQQATNSSSTTSLPNSFTLSSLEATNSSLNTGTYSSDGNIVVTSAGTLAEDYPQVGFSGTVTKGLYMTMSFTVKQISGTLEKISLSYDSSSLTPTVYTIDGVAVKTALDDNTGSLLVNTSGTQIALNDGNAHSVVVTFKTLISGSVNFNLYVNAGYNALTTPVVLNLGSLYIEDGQSATSWIINPADVSASSTVNRSKNYLVTDGKIYLAGAVRYFKAQTISIMGTGTETIGVTLNESIVTSAEDTDLLDHTDGAVTNGMAGADRLKYSVDLTYNDDTATPIYVFQDNQVNSNGVKPQYDSMTNILAKRTYDQSGSFRVSGFNVTVKDYALDDTKLQLAIDAGQAYVRGYSIATSSTNNVLVDKSFATATETNDGFVYSSSTTDYTLNYQPVQTVNNVTASIQGSNVVSRSSSGVQDQFTTESVYQIVSVKSGTTTYTEGTDFVRTNGNYITWGQDASGNTLVNANVPTAGTSYTVVYNYSKNLTQGTDYEVVTTGDDSNSIPQTAIDIVDMGGLKPIPGTMVYVTYVYFLAREDMIMLSDDDTNPFTVHQGTPAPLATVAPPTINDPYSLELGYVLIYPNMDKGVFTMQTTNNITFSNLTKWSNRLNNLEDNIISLQLKNAVAKSEDPVYAKDSFADAFNSVDMADNTNSDFTASYDFELGQITIPAKAYTDISPTIATDTSDINVSGSLVTAPYTQDTVISQSLITGTLNVNEYEVYNVNGSMAIDPSSDNWIDTTSTVVENDTNGGAVSFSRWWRHGVYDTNGASESANMVLENNMEGVTYGYGASAVQTGYVISSGGSKTVESLIEYIRERTINFTASNFLPYTDDFSITIEGVPVLSPTPASSTYTGSTTDTFKADGNGIVKGSFTIPGGTIKCGTRTIKIYNPNGAVATTNYTAQGTLKNVESIINKTTYSVSIVDPLAQSFTLSDTRYLTSLDLYFATKATTNDGSHTSDVTVQIRELSDDGYPNKTIKASQTLTPSDINTSTDGSAATTVTFDNAVALTANQGYCIAILTDSNAYNMYIATKGKAITTGDNHILQATPNSNGVMFTSSNAQTWVADPSSSLKFDVKCAYYNTTGTVVFDPIILKNQSYTSDSTDSVTMIDHFVALTSYLTPQQTSMTWYYRVLPASSSSTIDNMSWQALTPANDNEAIEAEEALLEASSEIQLKAVFSSSRYVSPILTTEDLSLAGILTGTEAHYYSVNNDESDSDAQFSHVKMQFDAYIPTGTSVTPYYSVDGGSTYYTLSTNGTDTAVPTSQTKLSSYYTRYIYNGTVPTATDINHYAKQVKFKLVLKATTNFVVPIVRQLTALMSVPED